jgi:GGDEF domain-containing protein
LPGRAQLQRWTARLGRGTLPVGLVAVRLLDADDLRVRHGVRLELAAVQTVATGLRDLVDGAEQLVQLGRHDFLFVLPSAQPARVAELRRSACAAVTGMQQRYPFVALRVSTSATVTRDRPLPVTRLLDELASNQPAHDPTREWA